MNNFADRLKQLRKQQGLSQSQLGDLVGVHYNHIGRYERGTSLPSADVLSKLADVLDVSSDYLYEGERDSAVVVDFEDRELLQHFLDVQNLDDVDKQLVKEFLGAFLVKKKLQELVSI
ncbi:MAG: XRE family transcriptional regulator [Gammaproteobacteria bacterium]|nr:MAG: XRE family transcriptional regulator [Gammaproteobacteria bacterium]